MPESLQKVSSLVSLLKGVVVTSKNGPEFARWESCGLGGDR